MNISCQRCSTVYELDESLLASEGSPVQCTRCQHVFTARPPGAKGETLVGVPAVFAPAPGDQSAPVAAVSGSGTDVLPGAPQLAAQVPSQPPAARVPVPARGAPAPVYRPTPGAFASAAPGRSAPVVRKDAIGTFESRLRWSARIRWLIPAASALVVAGVAAAWWFSRTPSADPAPEPERAAVQATPRREAPRPASPLPEAAPAVPPQAAPVPAVYVVPSAAGEAAAAPRNETSQATEPTDAIAPAGLPEPPPRPVRRNTGVLAPATVPALDAASALPVIEPPAAVVRNPSPAAHAPEPATELEPPPSSDGG